MFDVINNTMYEIEKIDELKKYISFVVKNKNIDNAIFNVIFVNNKEIKKLNNEYRKIDKETDVISFALEDVKGIETNSFRMLGDIYISIEKAKEQAEIYGHSIFREICFLTTHGILHLLGYDHMNEEDEKVMFSLQEELLQAYDITR